MTAIELQYGAYFAPAGTDRYCQSHKIVEDRIVVGRGSIVRLVAGPPTRTIRFWFCSK
jgi:hypothetical protein